MIFRWFCLFIIGFYSAVSSAETLVFEDRTMASHFYFTPDTGIAPAKVNADLSDWQQKSFPGLPLDNRNLWIQVQFDFERDKVLPQTLFVAALGSYKVWWDGEFLGENGRIGRSVDTEIPGRIERTFALPGNKIHAGKHVLKMQFAAHHNRPDQGYGMFWAYLTQGPTPTQLAINNSFLPIMMCGALLLLSCYCLMHFTLTDKHISYLIFSVLCIFIIALYLSESWRSLWGYGYDWHIPRLQIILVMTLVVANLLVAFLLSLFQFSWRECAVWFVTLWTIQGYFLYVFVGYDTTSLQLFLAGVALSLGITIRAVWSKKQYALAMFIGLLLFVAPVTINSHYYMEQYFFISFAALVVLMLFILSRSIQRQQQSLLQSQLTAARLELELVKRNIQPHFILNTLTAVEEWIEQSPKTAIQFVQALAEEFRQIAHSSKQTMIEIDQEIALCKAHLDVMAYRAQGRFSLHVVQPKQTFQLPPGVLLTLIENALSHNRYGAEYIIFDCQIGIRANTVSVVFSSPIENLDAQKALNTGLGQEYLQARMKESFNLNWQHHEHEISGKWVCSLSFPLIPSNTGDAL